MKPLTIGSNTAAGFGAVRAGETYLCVVCRQCGETIALMQIFPGASLPGSWTPYELEGRCHACGRVAGYLVAFAKPLKAGTTA